MGLWRYGVLAVGLTGCIFGGSLNGENWPRKAAKETCDFSRRCATANFFATYVDQGQCRAEAEAALQAEADEALGCIFVKDFARDCINALTGSCRDAGEQAETIFEPCNQVWACLDDDRDDDPTTDSGL